MPWRDRIRQHAGWRDIRAGFAHPAFAAGVLLEALALLVLAFDADAARAFGLGRHAMHAQVGGMALKLIAYQGLFILITVLLTAGAPAFPRADRVRSHAWRFRLGFVVVLAVIVATALAGLAYHGRCLLPGAMCALYRSEPVLLVVFRWRLYWSQLANPLLYALLPAGVLLLLGARPREIGCGRGFRSLRVALWWCAIPPAVVLGWRWFQQQVSGAGLLHAAVSNFLQNGPMEEFLFRGALLTRLLAWCDTGWAIAASALAFGVWHLGLNLAVFHGAWLPALAACVVNQGAAGVAFAVIMLRTGNLFAPSAAHVAVNMLG